MEIKLFFSLCENVFPLKCRELRRTCLTLRREGFTTMEEVYRAQRYHPKKIAAIRGVGLKTIEIVEEVCLYYEKEFHMKTEQPLDSEGQYEHTE